MGEQKGPRRFSREFKLGAVERMQAEESPSALARELGVKRKSLYEWKKRVEAGGPENLRDSGRPGPVPGGVVVEREVGSAAHWGVGAVGGQAASTDPFFRERLAASRSRDGWQGGVYEAMRREREREGAVLTVEETCRETGVSRAGFYRHWHRRGPSAEETELRDRLQPLALRRSGTGRCEKIEGQSAAPCCQY